MNLPPLHQLSLRVAPTGNIDEPPVADDFVELKAVLERERDKPAGERAVKDVDNDVYERLIASVPVWRAYNELERVSREVPDVEGDEAQIEAQTEAIAVAQAQLDAEIEALAGGGATAEDIFDYLVDLFTWNGYLFEEEQTALRLFETMNTWLIAARNGGFVAPVRSRPPGFTSAPDEDSDSVSDSGIHDEELLQALDAMENARLPVEPLNYVHPTAAGDEFLAALPNSYAPVLGLAEQWVAETGLNNIPGLMQVLATRDIAIHLERNLRDRITRRMNDDNEYLAALQLETIWWGRSLPGAGPSGHDVAGNRRQTGWPRSWWRPCGQPTQTWTMDAAKMRRRVGAPEHDL